MSTIRATYVQHGSSAVPNITLNASGQVIVASGIVSSGTFAAPTGSAAAPGVYFVGDTNTGLYSPGADQVAVATNGFGRVFVDANGRVGINTSTPDAGSMITIDSGFLASYRAINGVGGFATFGVTDISTSDGFVNCTNNLIFSTNSTERLRVTSAGLVGIGTSSPGASIHAVAANDPVLFLNRSASDGEVARFLVGGNTAFSFSTTAGGIRTIDGGNADFRIRTNSADRLTVTSTGNVGIGTTTPDKNLVVNQSNPGADVGIRIKNNTTTDAGTTASLRFTTSTGDFDTAALIADRATGSLRYEYGGSEKARLTFDGKLLVGTSTSLHHNAQIQTAGTGYYGYNHFQFSNDAFAPTISVKKSRSASVGGNTIVQDGDRLGTFSFFGADGSTFLQGADITAFVDGTPGVNDLPTRLVFSTTADGAPSPTERMRISQDGLTSVTHATAGQVVFNAENTSASFTSAVIRPRTTRAAGTDCFYLFAEANTVNTFVIYNNGNVLNTNNSYGSLSDIKLKENIVDAASQWSDIKALQVRKYNFKEETGQQTHTQIGLIAQEVELVSPGLVSEAFDRDEEGAELETTTKSINYSVLYMKAVKALQEAMERIEQLEAEMAEVKAQLS